MVKRDEAVVLFSQVRLRRTSPSLSTMKSATVIKTDFVDFSRKITQNRNRRYRRLLYNEICTQENTVLLS